MDDYIHAGVNFFATSQEIAREWLLMGEDTLEFENAKNAFAEEREKFNAEKKDLAWRRIAKLEKFAAEKVAENKASEILVEEVTVDCKWLLALVVPVLAKYMYELGEAAYTHGRKEGYAKGRATAEAKEPLKSFDLYKTDCVARYAEKQQEFESLEFAIVKAAGKLSRKPDEITLLKRVLGEEDREAGVLVLATRNEGFQPACRVSRMNDGADRLCCVSYLSVTQCCVMLWGNSATFVLCCAQLWGPYNVCFTMLSMLSCLYGHEVLFGMIGFSCVFDPVVHLVVTSLGGLQRFLCLTH
ncbi:hypothetical protein Hanom_Chr14g01261361 [Helianthus anomalus]